MVLPSSVSRPCLVASGLGEVTDTERRFVVQQFETDRLTVRQATGGEIHPRLGHLVLRNQHQPATGFDPVLHAGAAQHLDDLQRILTGGLVRHRHVVRSQAPEDQADAERGSRCQHQQGTELR